MFVILNFRIKWKFKKRVNDTLMAGSIDKDLMEFLVVELHVTPVLSP